MIKATSIAFFFLMAVGSVKAQNLVPNGSFEDTSACMFTFPPQIDCLNNWSESVLNNPNFNTPDLCYNGALFFPPSSIAAFDGTKYIGVDCQPMNSEYVQTELLQPLQTGKSYCVSFYVSICDQTFTPASSLGAFFSDGMLTANPYVNGLSAHVQGTVPNDPTIWTRITGVYTAAGGEDHITLGGFQNSGQPAFVYMYIDRVEVYALPDEQTNLLEICPTENLTFTAAATATAYLWSTGETTSSITISLPGVYTVEQTFGYCTTVDTFVVTPGSCSPDTTVIIEEPVEQTLFIPSAFTPNQDGINDVWSVYGENLTDLDVTIFNRWGEIVFTSTSLNFTWDGTHRSQQAQDDVYVYDLKHTNAMGIIESRRGRITLVR